MSFEQLLSGVSEGALRAVAIHWNEARGQRRMPGWPDIRPGAIVRQLPIVWSWKYDREADLFVGRLAGEEIVEAFGESLRGKTAEEFFRNRGGEAIVARHRQVVLMPCYFHGTGAVFAHAGRIVVGERIILPLAADGETPDGILGATVYRYLKPASDAGGANLTDESGTFVPL
ncbi:MAG: PAS domain-containing protein [Parvibaculum sp.]|uniref:PAS domain-containing protein n=1 Tax=Parvibaculum sp. TaxID=2024848 RepID=UPI003C720CC0